MKAWAGTKRTVAATVEVKWTQIRSKNSLSEGLGGQAKTEGWGLLESCVKVGEIPTGSNMH